MLRASFGVLRQLLLGLGFTSRATSKSVRFDHPETRTWFLFQPYSEADDMDAADLAAVRNTLDEKGLLPRHEFEQRLAARPVAG